MEPDSLSFLTLINKVQSHSEGGGGGLRGVVGVCFQDTRFLAKTTVILL